MIEKFIVQTSTKPLNATFEFVRTDNERSLWIRTLDDGFESVGISHETSVPRSPQQNGVVERRNRTLMEAARILMLNFAKAPLFLWAEDVATACYTLNRSLVHTLHGKTYYELLKGKKPNLQYFRVFGSLCYSINDYDDFCNVFEHHNAPETDSEASSSNSVNIDVTPNNQLPHVQKWTQAHPLENIIGDKDRPVSTRKQLETDAMWCFFNEFLTHVEPKTYKQACEHSVAGLRHAEKFMIERQDLDEYGDVLKNKARLVAKGYRQEAGIDLKNHLLQLLDKSDSVLIIAHAASLNMVIFKMDVKNPPSSIHTRTE
ncbi:retrovirus-related pol polyprotein from transposon TNT 1-94 [Tanacetum coccineum]